AYYLQKWRAKRRIPLSKEVAKDRYNFIYDWLRKTDKLIRTIFSDKCSYQNNTLNPTAWVFRFPSKKYDRRFINLKNYI
ncbi:uncharacterized protein P884DRAFT_207454, partial [Thermothelomyces heterothallicus CBS 202.75]|uniref:uncharacterized protein n=1 Tax=Thermothelomyces heterothallicus CBS 202.75 TaxID=1149848 RepID=UPI0037441321